MHDTEYDLKNWTIEDIADELDKVNGEIRELQPKIIKGGGDPDYRFTEKYNSLQYRERALTDELQMRRNEAKLSSTSGRITSPNTPNDGVDRSSGRPMVRHYGSAASATGTNGFKSLGEFALVVKESARRGATINPRLVQNAPTTISTEGVGSDGGFAVPPQYVADIAQIFSGEESLLGRCFQIMTPSNNHSHAEG